MTSPRTLREWCRVTCARYPDVEVRDMSSSFRDGLVFCAIIHRHRPDLIDFSSLSKANIYHNNKLAFEIAETRLGIPALLDPDDMVTSTEPDGLSIITYVSQYYQYFTWRASAGPVSLKPSPVSIVNNLSKTRTPGALRPPKSSSQLKPGPEVTGLHAAWSPACSLCLKPVHLIQRRWVNGKVYHRRCFRCRVCHSTLLAGSFTRGTDGGFLFCTHHLTDAQSPGGDLSAQPAASALQDGYYSLGGLLISSVPHYTKTTESPDGPVCETEGEEKDNRELAAGLKSAIKKPARPHRPQHEAEPADEDTQEEEREEREPCTPSSPRPPDTRTHPVPAPRRMLDPSAAPVPAPRRPLAAGEKSSSSSQVRVLTDSVLSLMKTPLSVHALSPLSSFSGSPKVRSNHPWFHIVHPGPWTQLPPAPPPVPAPRSRFSKRCSRPRIVPPNPFAEDLDEETKSDSAAQSAGRDGVSLNPFADDEDTKRESEDTKRERESEDTKRERESEDTKRESEDTKREREKRESEDTKRESEDTKRERESEDTKRESEDTKRERESEDTKRESEDTKRESEDTKRESEDMRTLTVTAVCLGDDVDVNNESRDQDVVSLNPFSEFYSEDTKAESSNQTSPAGGAAESACGGDVSDQSGSSSDVLCSGNAGETAEAGCVVSVPAEGVLAVMLTEQTSGDLVGESSPARVSALRASLQNVNAAAARPRAASDEAQTYILPRSLSVPAISSSCGHSSSLCGDLTETRGCDQVTSSQSQLVCKKNPKHAMSKSKTFQSLPSRRGPAPGHGFPLIRRKVQTEQNVSSEDLRLEMTEVDKHLEALERRGVELERSLRDCRRDKDEEQMLTQWFSVVQETNALVRRDTELVYLTKQQKLEERQADVEYGLRCLLNKPEGEWSDRDRGEEQQLMDELVAIIEQRNQIVSSLDQDRLSEREEDLYLRAVMKDKELQKEELKDLKKSKSKFSPSKVFKMLNHKTNDT
ncbi:MICAL-like protein 1 [Labrus mixtus]|uniref:MICAL-like protein 1 n=1 Tax=Labrus mixtus TaxID=508554 RepID=UPI0029C0920D|nr:MICAL-like protein 1 [Labrus mixtus]